jgi:DNA primase
MPDTFIDYQKLKRELPIEKVAQWLELPLAKSGDQLRGPCPACNSGGPRALVITPAKAAHYCFSLKRGGDCIALVAHIRGTGQKDAALWLIERMGTATASTVSTDSTSTRKRSKRKSTATKRRNANSRVIRLIHTNQLLPANEDEPAPSFNASDWTC